MRRAPDLTRAAHMAYRVLAARELRALPVDPLALLRACRDTVVYTADDAADALDMRPAALERLFTASEAVTFAETAEGRTRYIVLYRPGGNPARLRFTLAHELGHRVLGHAACENADEREADCFASHLLCPQPVLTRLRQSGACTPERVATLCYVSIACAKAALSRRAIPTADDACRRVAALLCGDADGEDSQKPND